MSLDFYLFYENDGHKIDVFWKNITHNLGKMAEEADVYDPLWRPDQHGFEKAKDVVEPLRKGLLILRSDPRHFSQFDSPNGWGKYENFVPFVEAVLEACIEYPNAKIRVSR